MRSIIVSTLSAVAMGAAIVAGPARAAPANPYGDYAALVGDWDLSSQAGEAPVAVTHFRWGPNRSYIWISQTMLMNGKEVPHFEGMLMWNGVEKDLDLLVALDLTYGLAVEKGVLRTDGQGGWVREITTSFSEGSQPIGMPAPGPQGAIGHFRQTFTPQGSEQMVTSVMRQTADGGWTPTFPGSDHLVMTRRKAT